MQENKRGNPGIVKINRRWAFLAAEMHDAMIREAMEGEVRDGRWPPVRRLLNCQPANKGVKPMWLLNITRERGTVCRDEDCCRRFNRRTEKTKETEVQEDYQLE